MVNEDKRKSISPWWLLLGGFLLLSVCSYQMKSKQDAAPAQTAAKLQAKVPVVAKAEPIPTPPAEDIMKPLADATVVMQSIKPDQCTPDTAETCLSLLNGLGETLWGFKDKSLTPEQQKQVAAFRSSLVKTQQATFPDLRKSYGKVLADKVWEHDVDVKTLGTSNRTVELVGPTFAARRNMVQMNESILPLVMKLRYTRIQYRWAKTADAAYFDLAGKNHANDTDILIWTDDGRYVEVK